MSDSKNEKKKPMSDVERLKLAEKLDNDLEEFMKNLPKREKSDPVPVDELIEDLQNHPFFMKNLPKEGDKLHPLYEGLQQLKYDPEENTAEDLANSYKDDGNFNFKHKKYRLAILTYTEGIKTKCENKDLIATLYNNRAAANFYLKNYRSALKDCEEALKNKPDYEKPLIRAANCCFESNKYDKCIKYCDMILQKTTDHKEILALRQNAVNKKKMDERDLRKREMTNRKAELDKQKIYIEISKRGIKLNREKRCLTPTYAELRDFGVHLDELGQLVWPVVIVYPEFVTVDFIQNFSENDRLIDHLSIVLEQNPEWDTERKYNINSVNVYFENNSKKTFKINMTQTLKEIITHGEYIVSDGVPRITVFCKGSVAEKFYLDNHS